MDHIYKKTPQIYSDLKSNSYFFKKIIDIPSSLKNTFWIDILEVEDNSMHPGKRKLHYSSAENKNKIK